MKLVVFFVLAFSILFLPGELCTQTSLAEKELALSYYCDVMSNASEPRHRLKAMEEFNTQFVSILAEPGAYDYPFDSLKWISKLVPEDKQCRIFTWEVNASQDDFRYFGLIQTREGKVIPLTDKFREAEDLSGSEFPADQWLGSVYYNILTIKEKKDKTYYVLFGMRRENRFENTKLVDPLFFTSEGEVFFGKPVFRKKEADGQTTASHRLLFRYSSDSKVTVNYNPGMNMIMADHLIARMGRLPGQGQSFVPDGSYIGFEREESFWNYIDKIATDIMETAPRPRPVLDERKGKKIFGN
jgi:hypothetical protein